MFVNGPGVRFECQQPVDMPTGLEQIGEVSYRWVRCAFRAAPVVADTGGSIWVPKGSLACFLVAFLRSGWPRRIGKAFKNAEGEAPHILEGRAPGAGQTSKTHPQNPARLPSGTPLSAPIVPLKGLY